MIALLLENFPVQILASGFTKSSMAIDLEPHRFEFQIIAYSFPVNRYLKLEWHLYQSRSKSLPNGSIGRR